MPPVVSRPDLESLLSAIARETADPRAGIFGPESMAWQISRESALFLGSARAALLQLAHPWVAAAIAEHSAVLHDPIARFHNTFRVVYTMIFGNLAQALAAARHLHTLHTGIRGELCAPVAVWPRGAHYEANELAALRWIYATLIESAVLSYEWVLPLPTGEREQYYQDMKVFAALFGIPAAMLPSDWSAFSAYTQAMVHSGELGVGAVARSLGQTILSGAGSWIRPPRWYRALTAAWLPQPLRDAFGLTLDSGAVARVHRWLPRVYRSLPSALRFVGPYHEAQARLRGRPASLVARASNRFWIGQAALPFTGT